MTRILRVDELSQQLEPIIAAITPQPVYVRGTLTTWKRSRAWQRGELVTHLDNDVAAKLTIGCKAKRGVAISSRLAAAGTPLEPPIDITVCGMLTYHQRWGFRFELLEMTTETLSQDNERLRTESELAVLRAENASLRTQLEAAQAQRDSALDALRMLATRPGVHS